MRATEIRLEKEKYMSGDKFDNPFPIGLRTFVLYIYPDPKFNNDWVAALSGENDISDRNRIIVNKDIMKRRVALASGSPYVTRGEMIKLFDFIVEEYGHNYGPIAFTI